MGLSRRRIAAILLFGIFSVYGVNAAPAPQAGAPNAVNPNACAAIASATNSLLAASPLATPTVAATLALECLQTVPNKIEPAQRLVKSLKAFVQWQSSLAFLRDPPQSYGFPAVDIQSGLDSISAKAAAGGFANEFDFQLAIVQLITSAHDGHFSFRPDVFKAFGFRNKFATDIVSISVDGVQVPKLYHYAELMANSTAGALPRSIILINGEDAATVIERRNLVFSGYQDRDSQWNAAMQSYALPTGTNFVAASLDFNGAALTIMYDTGETRTEDNFAIIRPGVNFTGISTGEDFYNRFCNPDTATVAAADATSTSPATPTVNAAPEPTINGYPFPFIRDSGANITSGYFLNGTGYDDVAVLAVSAFSAGGGISAVEYLTNFQDTVATFLAQSKLQNKKRLVIDVTANGGGFVVAGYELFAQIFPDAPDFQANNLRESDSLKLMAETSGRFLDQIINFNGNTDANSTDIGADAGASTQAQAFSILQQSSVVSNLVPGGVFTPDGGNLTSVAEILGPVTLKGDRFTAYQFTPLNMTNSDFNLTGTGSRSNPPPAVFAPEDVVLLTDGTCGSTCTIFSYLMILQLGVRTTVVGGRPQNGPMQSVGGVEGAQVFFFEDISAAASAVLVLSPADNVTDSEIALLDEGYALRRAANPARPGAVNGKNAFMRADAQTPLQFLYQPANCRFFYTKDMIYGPEEVWKRTVDATWTDPARFCVEGSRVEVNMSLAPTDARFSVNARLAGESAAAQGANSSLVFAVMLSALVVALLGV
ncbi:peptidase S41 family protein [Podospora didyma]|uniref:Peptidase S41 family protein n=1 Tax=Podospora didyma TaxID=330526 RepID=A0AAE0U3F7_9PEZI|nr:peptidase S41 family protein [Podospora didyma]